MSDHKENDIKELHKRFLNLRNDVIKAECVLHEFIERCNHIIEKVGNEDWASGRCKICEKHFGWWCETSPNKQCKIKGWYGKNNQYYDESCIYCGQPDERK